MTKLISPGQNRFKKFLDPLAELLRNAEATENPAPYLFSNGARDLLFRLEALSRIYKGLHNKKLFDNLNEDFKELEDAMGEIDYFDAFEKEFLKIKTLPPAFINYFIEGRNTAQEKLNKIIRKKKWISGKSGKLGEIESSLSGVDWIDADAERKAIGEFLVDQIDKFISKYDKGKLHFNDIEEGVHEFRRKLRWFSIYAASLDGLIQLKISASPDEDLKKYLQPEILNSPYNVLPEASIKIHPIFIQDQYFYALSWVISETGNLKDEGLRNEAIEAAVQNGGVQLIEVTDMLNSREEKKESTKEEVCSKAESIADTFIYKDMVMEKIKRDIYRGMEAVITN